MVLANPHHGMGDMRHIEEVCKRFNVHNREGNVAFGIDNISE
jgi:hypothetical protein